MAKTHITNTSRSLSLISLLMGVFLSVEPRGFSITQVKSLYKTLMKSDGLLNPPSIPVY